ncbi:LysE family translocator [Paenibacillus glycanilyticus]|uniref:LysE family translocator n=1 Tax=Paenibacillus glycanilyticus TaxID=126569 RepID=UPI0035A231A6
MSGSLGGVYLISVGSLIAFGLVSLGMVCTPGPNMIYLISRSITQGRKAGVVSLGGVVLGFVIYLFATLLGLTTIFHIVPFLYTAIKWAGAAYLLWLAWNAIKPGSRSVFEVKKLTIESPRRLFFMGFMTNLFNPKIAVLYISLLPQFQVPGQGSLLLQGTVLGMTQIIISLAVNLLIVLLASRIASLIGGRPLWLKAQRWIMSSVLTGLAFRLAFERR